MRKLLVITLLAFTLGGCGTQLEQIKQAYETVSGLKVSAKSVVVISSSFNTLKSGATQYLVYCKTNLERNVCSADNRRKVIRYVDEGTKLRDQLQEAAKRGDTVPTATFNALKGIITALGKSPAAESFGVAQ